MDNPKSKGYKPPDGYNPPEIPVYVRTRIGTAHDPLEAGAMVLENVVEAGDSEHGSEWSFVLPHANGHRTVVNITATREMRA